VKKARALGSAALLLSLPLAMLLAGAGTASVGAKGWGPAVQDHPAQDLARAQDSVFPAFKPAPSMIGKGSPLFWAVIGAFLTLALLALLLSRMRPLQWLAMEARRAVAWAGH
jgi:hypothetical protein